MAVEDGDEEVDVIALPEGRRDNDFYRWVHRMNSWAAGGSVLPAVFRGTVVGWNRLRQLWGGRGTDITPIVYLHQVMTTIENLRGAVPDGIETYEHPPARYADSPFYGFPPTGVSTAWSDDGTTPKTEVLGVEAGGEVVVFPRTTVESAGGVVQATVGDTPVVVFATDDGMAAYEDPGAEFEHADGAFVSAEGTRWDPLTGGSDDGRRLRPATTRRSYAFAWVRDHGEDRLFDGPAAIGEAPTRPT